MVFMGFFFQPYSAGDCWDCHPTAHLSPKPAADQAGAGGVHDFVVIVLVTRARLGEVGPLNQLCLFDLRVSRFSTLI
jgi:hypothetical protein